VLDADGYMANAKQWVDAARARGLQCLIVLSHVDKIDVDIATRPGAVFEVALLLVLFVCHCIDFSDLVNCRAKPFKLLDPQQHHYYKFVFI